MAPVPVCSKCSKPHYNFVTCDKADAWNEKRVVSRKPAGESMSITMRTVPEGFRASRGWGDNHGWRSTPDGFRPWGGDAA